VQLRSNRPIENSARERSAERFLAQLHRGHGDRMKPSITNDGTTKRAVSRVGCGMIRFIQSVCGNEMASGAERRQWSAVRPAGHEHTPRSGTLSDHRTRMKFG